MHSSPQTQAPYVADSGDSMLPIAGPIKMPTLKDAIRAPKPVALVEAGARHMSDPRFLVAETMYVQKYQQPS
jgi:hypothetical protein